MIELDHIKNYFPAETKSNAAFHKYMVKEYAQLLILEFLSTSAFLKKMVFIGGTNLRLVKGINRFSEDLDFDCKDFSKEEFFRMTDDVLVFLQRSGFNVETRDKENTRLKAFRRTFYFPGLLFDLKLSAYKEEHFLVKIESQDQGFDYKPVMVNIRRMGFFFPFPVPPDDVLCAMKIAALLSRQKGRDFYDVMFLLGQTPPNYDYLSAKCGIHNLVELKKALASTVKTTDLKIKSRDFEHLLFNKEHAGKILAFAKFIKGLA